MKKWKNLKISEKVRYIIGICLIIGGASGIATGDFFSGVLTGIFGLSLFPIVYKKLNISTEKKLHIVIPIILFLLTSIFMPSSEETANTVDTTNTVVKESNIEENKTIESEVENSEETEQIESTTKENNKEEKKGVTVPANSTVTVNSTDTSSSNGQATKPYNPIVEESKEESESTTTEVSKEQEIVPDNPVKEESNNETTTIAPSTSIENIDNSGTVYVTPYGKRYHLDAECGGENSSATTLNQAINSGRTPCKKCAQ